MLTTNRVIKTISDIGEQSKVVVNVETRTGRGKIRPSTRF
jgi:hypothetical protein